MKSGNHSNPAPEAQRPPSSGLPMLHITLNTGLATEHHDADLAPAICAFLEPLLRKCVGAIPGMPGFAVAWHGEGDAVLLEIVHEGVPVTECGLAWGPNEASSLWKFLSEGSGLMRLPAETQSGAATSSIPRPPWMGIVRLAAFATLSATDAALLPGFESCLGLALLRHRFQRDRMAERRTVFPSNAANLKTEEQPTIKHVLSSL